MTCWQVYQMPGLESRGLYGEGEGPDEDEPGDPNYVPGADEPGSNEIDQLVSTYGERATVEELIQVLLGPTALPGTVTP